MNKKEEEPTFEELLEQLEDEDWERRKQALFLLNKHKHQNVLSILVNQYNTELDYLKKKDILYLIVEKDSPKAKKLVDSILFGETIHMRLEVAKKLSEMKNQSLLEYSIDLLEDKKKQCQETAIYLLEHLASETTKEGKDNILLYLKTHLDHLDENIRELVISKVESSYPKYIFEVLGRRIQSRKTEERMSAVKALKKLKDSRAVELLTTRIQDDDLEVRLQVIKALGESGDSRAVYPLNSVLEHEGFKEVREQATKALKQLQKSKAVDQLIHVLRDEIENIDTRSEASKLLEILGGERVIDQLVQILHDADSYAKQKASHIIIELGGEKAVEPLIQVLRLTNTFWRKEVTDALIELGEERVVEPLIQSLEDKDSIFRENVARALGEVGDSRAIEPLNQALKEEQNIFVKRAIVAALGRLKQKLKK